MSVQNHIPPNILDLIFAYNPESSIQSRPRDNVRSQRRVNIEQDSRIGIDIQLLTKRAIRHITSTTSDFQIESLWVVLSAIQLTSRVQSDNLMAHSIVTRSESRGDLHSPLAPSSNKLIGGPCTRRSCAMDETVFFNLEELQCCLVNCAAVTVA